MKVCEKEFPKKAGDRRHSDGFFMEQRLKTSLDFYIKNVHKDWDYLIVISGEGEVRVGKSVLAQQIAAYWCSEIKRIHNVACPLSVKENIVFPAPGTPLTRRV